MSKKINIYYYLSFLCLFPGFGTIFGIVLIFYTYSKFHNKQLLALLLATSVGGIGIGYLISSTLKHEFMYGEEAGNMISRFAVDDLDFIAKKLELYKSVHGSYPDSLAQLKKENRGLNIADPLLTRNPKAHKFLNYFYEKKGDTYILFSSGVDGIPYTSDDLFPRKPLR